MIRKLFRVLICLVFLIAKESSLRNAQHLMNSTNMASSMNMTIMQMLNMTNQTNSMSMNEMMNMTNIPISMNMTMNQMMNMSFTPGMMNMTMDQMMNMPNMPDMMKDPSCKINSSCSLTGSGNSTIITCVLNATCKDCIRLKTCFAYMCYNCSLNSFSNSDVYRSTNNDFMSNCGCLNCTKCFEEMLYLNQTNSTTFNYSYASNLNSSVNPKDISTNLSNAIDLLINSAKNNYKKNICIDNRVPKYFGDKDFSNPEYQSNCKNLVTDYEQFYMPFQCNDWVCNFKGKCSLSNNQTNDAVNVLCNCAQGYTGKNCLYTNKDYNYLFNWTLSIGAWLDQITKNGNYRVNDEDTFFNIINVANSLLSFVKTVNTDDMFTVVKVIGKLMNVIFNSNVNNKSVVTNSVISLINQNFEDKAPMIGIDPALLCSTFNCPEITNVSTNGFYKGSVNYANDISIGLISTSKILRILTKVQRKLASVSNTPKYLNMAVPTANIPKSVSLALPANTKLSFSFYRDPNNFYKESQVKIHSQIVALKAYSSSDLKKFYAFPNISDKVNFKIPWAFIPMKLMSGSFVENCKAFKFDGNRWLSEPNCVLLSNTDENNAYVNCASFETVGISCSSMFSIYKSGVNMIKPSIIFVFLLYTLLV